MPVGDPVAAVDPNGDTLTYDLWVDHDRDGGTVTDVTADKSYTDTTFDPDRKYNTDLAFFSVDKATGQLMVAKTLSFEASDGRDYDGTNAATAGKYEIVIRAVDPSGENDTVKVTIMAEQANDAPVIMGSLTREAYLADDEAKNPPAASWLVVKEKDDDLEGKPNAYTGSWDMLLPDQANAGLGQSNVFTASDEDARGQIFWSLRVRTLISSCAARPSSET